MIRSRTAWAGIVAAALLSGCGGSSKPYGEHDVIAAFGKHGIVLWLVMRPGPQENPLKAILRANDVPANCDEDDLVVNLWVNSSSVHQYLKRQAGAVRRRYTFGSTIGLIDRNLIVSLRRNSPCFHERDVEAALAELH